MPCSRRIRAVAATSALAAAMALTGASGAPAIPGDDYDPTGGFEEMPLHHAPQHWRESPILWQWSPHWLSDNPVKLVGAWVAYQPTNSSEGVGPGEVFHARVSAGVGETRGGGALVRMGLELPSGVELAIDGNHPVRCLHYDANDITETDVTGDPGAACPGAPAATGAGNLGERVVPNMHQFVIDVPLRATVNVAGRELIGAVESDQVVDPAGPLHPRVWFGQSAAASIFNWAVVCVWDNPNNPGPC